MATRPILLVGDTRAVLSGFTPEPVSLAALKASGIRVEWHEGVAILREACRRLLDSSNPQPPSEVAAADIKIDLTGNVFVPRGGLQDGPSAVSQLGTALRDLLADNMPVPLRLAISQAMANPPHYDSIKSFSEALSYFERPDPARIIRGLYERWEASASSRGAPDSRHESVTANERGAEEPVVEQPRRARSATPRWLVLAGGIGLAITLALVLAAVWVRNADEVPSSDQPVDSTPGGSPVVGVAPQDGTAKLRAAAPPETAARRPVAHPATPAKAVTVPVRPFTSSGEEAAPIAAPLPTSARSIATADRASVSVTILEPEPGSRIYSSLDTDVAAPVAAYPQSPTVATVLHDDEVLTFDVVIDEVGKVESVKLRRAPRSIRSALMLTMSMSVAKAWRFQPATRRGQSVKYRQSISVPASQ
jgi:hypothetical protein